MMLVSATLSKAMEPPGLVTSGLTGDYNSKCALSRGPGSHASIRIPRSGPKAHDKGNCRNHDLSYGQNSSCKAW